MMQNMINCETENLYDNLQRNPSLIAKLVNMNGGNFSDFQQHVILVCSLN